MVSAATKHVNLLVVASPETPELDVLKQLPAEVKVVATGQTLADLSKQLSDEQWGSIDVLLNCGVGKFAGKREYIQVCRDTFEFAAIADHLHATERWLKYFHKSLKQWWCWW